MSAYSFEDRCVGCLLASACGDILGAAVEGWSREHIQETYGELRDFQRTGRGFGKYTDDTQMTLALATSIADHGKVDTAHVSAKYAEFYEAWRGYGFGAHTVMQALKAGTDYRQTGRLLFADGSFGNGGAMRIAPVGLGYRNAPEDVFRRTVEDAVLCTHVHPDGVDGAYVQARAIAELVKTREASSFDPRAMLSMLATSSQTEIMSEKLKLLANMLEAGAPDEEVIAATGNGVRASEAVPAAIWAFVRYWDTPEDCIVRAVGFGGDADTIGAMAGALAGAFHGISWIPARWYDNMENGIHGRDEIVAVARRLSALDITE